MDKPVAGPGEPAKKGLVFPHAYRRRGTEAATGGHMAENLLGRDGEAVCIAGSILDDCEGSQGDIVPGQKGRRQVTGAVCCYFYVHVSLRMVSESVDFLLVYRDFAQCQLGNLAKLGQPW